jgi:DNA-binding NarL/FixJ family response regulator
MLKNVNVLVIEKEFLIALDIQRMLETLDANEIILARNFADAAQLEHHWPRIKLAIVEVTLEPLVAYELVERLLTSGIAVVLSSGDTMLLARIALFASLPRVSKPMAENELVQAIEQAMAM